jgi:ATP-binding cassette subfamily B protein
MTPSNVASLSTMAYMRKLVSWQPSVFWVNCLTWSVFHTMPVFSGLIIREIFDTLSNRAATGWNAWTLLALYAVYVTNRQGILYAGIRIFSRFYLSTQALLRRNLLEYLVLAPGSRVLPEAPSEAISRFRDDVDDIAAYAEGWVDAVGFFTFAVAAFGLLIWVDPFIAGVAAAPLICMVFVMRGLSPKIRARRRAMREATARVTGFIGESYAAVQAVKVAGAEDTMASHFGALGVERRRCALADVLLTEMVRGVNNGFIFVAHGLMLTFAASRMRNGTFTVGDLALFMQLLPRLTNTLTFVGDLLAQHRRARVAVDRMEHLLVDAPAGQSASPGALPLTGPAPVFEPAPRSLDEPLQSMRVEGLTFVYPNTSSSGVHDISFELERGDFVVITGRIGSGKTTLLRALQGLVPQQQGSVFWNGKRIEDPASFFTPPHSSYTAQVPRLFSETLRHNVLLGDADEERLGPALDLAAMDHDLSHLEKGIDTLVGTRGVKLSGGQVQRAGAARMFARHADLLVFDDLSSALDAATERELWRGLLAADGKERTCLVVSHRRPALERATRILLLSQGRIVGQGKLEELLGASEEMRHLWDDEADEEGA